MTKTKSIEELPGNSISSRSAPVRPSKRVKKEVEPVVEAVEEPRKPRAIRAQIVRKKKTLSHTIAEAFVGDGTNGVGGYILNDVLIPAFKNLVTDAVTSGIEMLVYGETRGRSRGRDRERGPKVINYSSFSKRRYRDDDDDDDRRSRRRPSVKDPFDLNEIFFKDPGDADDVLEELCERVEEYEQVSVADYFELAGIDGSTHTHFKWGWDDKMPKKAFCTHTRHGWAIVLPEPIPLD
jgi:hypothetical protein